MTTTPRIDELIEDLLIPNAGAGYDQIRGSAVEGLLSIGRPAHEVLLARANAEDPPVRVLQVLPEFGDESSVPVLGRALADAPSPTTVVAADALARHPADSALDILIAALSSTREQTVKSAIVGLRLRGDGRAVGPLQEVRGSDELIALAREVIEELS
jgi:HEAT repeat protein